MSIPFIQPWEPITPTIPDYDEDEADDDEF